MSHLTAFTQFLRNNVSDDAQKFLISDILQKIVQIQILPLAFPLTIVFLLSQNC